MPSSRPSSPLATKPSRLLPTRLSSPRNSRRASKSLLSRSSDAVAYRRMRRCLNIEPVGLSVRLSVDRPVGRFRFFCHAERKYGASQPAQTRRLTSTWLRRSQL